jgi:chorismate dehydratase
MNLHDSQAGLRIGAVSYLNTVPLVRGLSELLPHAALSFDHPGRLADDLAAGRLDVALVPIVEVARHAEWSIASSACIASHGPVLSVKVLFRTPPAEVRTLALDEGSRTSAVLAQILLADRCGVRPRLVPLPVAALPGDVTADAVLLIGDRAIRWPDDDFVAVWDLGQEWRTWTRLPFVFAAWAARPGVALEQLEPALEAARDNGCRDVAAIAAEQSAAMGLPLDLVLTYLRDHLHFTLGESERRGMELYFRRAAELGLVPNEWRQADSHAPRQAAVTR